MVNSTNGREHRLLLYASHKTLFASDVEVRVSASAVGGLRRLPWGGSWSRARSRGMRQTPSAWAQRRAKIAWIDGDHTVRLFVRAMCRRSNQVTQQVVITSELHTGNSRTTEIQIHFKPKASLPQKSKCTTTTRTECEQFLFSSLPQVKTTKHYRLFSLIN
jgi:hypothetical protein